MQLSFEAKASEVCRSVYIALLYHEFRKRDLDFDKKPYVLIISIELVYAETSNLQKF